LALLPLFEIPSQTTETVFAPPFRPCYFDGVAMTEQAYQDLQRHANRICSLILISDYPEVDIVIKRSLLRGEIADNYPECLDLYDMIFESRFDRLWEQFRVPEAA
jgi:hypothetical protein